MRVFAVGLILLAAAMAGCAAKSSENSSRPANTVTSPETRDEPCLEAVVVDEELAPITNANLTIDELDLVVPTDASGQAKVCEIPHGTFHLAVAAAGYDTSRKTIQFPLQEPIRFTLRLLPVLVPYNTVIPKSLFYTVGLSTVDATVARFASLDQVACSPCSFELVSPTMPSFVYWEATWTRSAMVIPAEDQMHHVFRGGAPFENAPGDTTDRDIGSGAMTQPFHFQYHRNDMVHSPPVEAAEQAGGEVAFSGAMYCWGNPPAPCVNQRIDLYLTMWYNILKVPDDYSALPN